LTLNYETDDHNSMYCNKASQQINGVCSSVDEAVTEDWHRNVAQIMEQYAVQNTLILYKTSLVYWLQLSANQNTQRPCFMHSIYILSFLV